MLNLRGVKESVTHPGADLRPLPPHPRDPHRRRHRAARRRRCRGGRARPAPASSAGARHARAGRHVRRLRAGLLDGRRHLHRHRGGLQRPADHARAAGPAPPSGPWSTWPSRWRSPPAASWSATCSSTSRRSDGKTMNAVLLERFAGGWRPVGLPLGHALRRASRWSPRRRCSSWPRRPASSTARASWRNMAVDSWLPHRFAQLSERLTMQNGVLLMGGAALAALLYTRGERHGAGGHVLDQRVRHLLAVAARDAALLVAQAARAPGGGGASRSTASRWSCASRILAGTIVEKGAEGGWVTLVVTGLRGRAVLLHPPPLPRGAATACAGSTRSWRACRPRRTRSRHPAVDPAQPTAVLLVGALRRARAAPLLDRAAALPGPLPPTSSSSRSASWTPPP